MELVKLKCVFCGTPVYVCEGLKKGYIVLCDLIFSFYRGGCFEKTGALMFSTISIVFGYMALDLTVDNFLKKTRLCREPHIY